MYVQALCIHRMAHKVPVFDEDQKIVAHVEYSDNLDYWDGSNHTCGSTGRHLGLTVLKDGRFVLIHGSQWQGERSHAEIAAADDALQEVMRTDSLELLKSPRFKALKQLYDEKYANQELGDNGESGTGATADE